VRTIGWLPRTAAIPGNSRFGERDSQEQRMAVRFIVDWTWKSKMRIPAENR
jgi:hypothetical protein